MCEPVLVRAAARVFLAAALALLLSTLVPATGLANRDGDNNDNERRDSQSRNELPTSLDSIKVHYGKDRRPEEYRSLVLIRTRIVQVARTEDRGVKFESLDRVDVSDIPLLGGLFDRPLSAEDFTEENRIGTAYSTGNGALAAVIGDDAKIAEDLDISVVNDTGRFILRIQPRPVEIDRRDLSELGMLDSVQSLIAGTASRETTMVLGGLTSTSTPDVEAGVPVLSDIPVLQKLFRGTVHRGAEDTLLILIKPSVIIQQEE